MSAVWEPDSASPCCRLCGVKWTIFKYRRHHCRNCGKLVCYKCSKERIYLSVQDPAAVRVCDKCVEQIRSAEKPHLSKADQESDDGSVTLSVVSDGKCKATETPFRNTLQQNNATGSGLLEVADSDDERQPQGQWKTIPEAELATPTEGPTDNTHQALTLDEVLEFQQPNFEGIGAAPLSPGFASMASGTSDTYETPAALLNLQEGVVHRPSREPSLAVNLSKYGTMAFTDDESSPPPPSQHQDSPTAREVEADGSVPETVAADSSAATADADACADAGARDTAQSAGNTEAPSAADANPTSIESPKPKGPVKIVLKKRASVHTPTADDLHPGMSPMPTGTTVRRLSTLAPRTPFNSAVTMSPAAAEIAQAQQATQQAALEEAGTQLSSTGEVTTPAVATTEAAKEVSEPEPAVTVENSQEAMVGSAVELAAATATESAGAENPVAGESETVEPATTGAAGGTDAADADVEESEQVAGERQESVASAEDEEQGHADADGTNGTSAGTDKTGGKGDKGRNKGGRGGRKNGRFAGPGRGRW